jgi:hypothetical protein
MLSDVEINELNSISSSVSESKIFDDYEQKVTFTRMYFEEGFSFPLPSEYGPNDEEN